MHDHKVIIHLFPPCYCVQDGTCHEIYRSRMCKGLPYYTTISCNEKMFANTCDIDTVIWMSSTVISHHDVAVLN